MIVIISLAAVLSALIAVFMALPKPRGIADLPPPSQDVLTLMKSGQKVPAIRAYRKQAGATLFEANQVIEYYLS